MEARGYFITLEGGEGAGKSTQARLIAAWFGEKGISTVLTREPGGTPGAEEIRNLLVTGEVGRWDALTETLLHYAARRDHLDRFIVPALQSGQTVICDRFFDSTMAYQGYGHEVDTAFIKRLRQQVVGGFVPHLTLILDVSPETRRARTSGRPGNEDRYERMDEDFHARVRRGFRAIAAAESSRCVLIDADRPAEDVFEAIRRTVRGRFGIW